MRFPSVSTRAAMSGVMGIVAGAGLFGGDAGAVTQQGYSCGQFGSLSDGPGRFAPFTTTGGCLDININLTSAVAQTFGRSCLNPGGQERCSEWKLLPFKWTTLSTNVRGGTSFSIDLSGNNGQRIGFEIAY